MDREFRVAPAPRCESIHSSKQGQTGPVSLLPCSLLLYLAKSWPNRGGKSLPATATEGNHRTSSLQNPVTLITSETLKLPITAIRFSRGVQSGLHSEERSSRCATDHPARLGSPTVCVLQTPPLACLKFLFFPHPFLHSRKDTPPSQNSSGHTSRAPAHKHPANQRLCA